MDIAIAARIIVLFVTSAQIEQMNARPAICYTKLVERQTS